MFSKKNELVKEYFKLQKEFEEKYGKDSVILYEVGKFFECFGIPENELNLPTMGQIDKISEILNIQKTKPNKKMLLSMTNPYMCGFPNYDYVLEEKCNKLIQNNFTVGIVRQTSKNNKGKMNREIDTILSPSINIVSDSNILTNYLVCLYVEIKNITLTSIDLSTGKNECYITNNNDLISKTIHSINPKEIVIYIDEVKDISKDEKDKIMTLYSLHKYKIHYYNTIDKKIYNLAFQNLYLQTIFKIKNGLSTIENLSLEKYPSSIICYILMIQFIKEHDCKIIEKINKPKIIHCDEFLQLSTNTITQLHLIDINNDKNKSVFDIINKTSTVLGKRLLKERLLNPLTNPKKINVRYNEIEKLLQNNKYKNVEIMLKKIKDLDRLHRKLSLKKLNPCEFIDLHNTYSSIMDLINYFITGVINNDKKNDVEIIFEEPLKEQKEINYKKEYPCSNLMNNELILQLKEYINFYSNHLNLDILEKYNIDSANEHSLFKIGIYEDIDKIVITLKNQWNKFNTLKNELNNAVGEKCVKTSSTTTEGYYMTITNGKKSYLNDVKEKYELMFKQNKSVCKIFSPLIKQLSDKILQYQEKLKELNQKKFIDFLITIDEKYSEMLKKISSYIANLDFYNSGAIVSIKNHYTKPEIKDEYKRNSYLIANDIRHPIIEKINDTKYIPNDIIINNENKGVILTGFNSSGKSSILRSVAISCILSQIGYFVPCSKFQFFPFNKIITKIALTDNLHKKESGFISELKIINNMIENADCNTLCFCDELFVTTESISGCSLMASTILTLLKKESNFIFTTHYHALFELEQIKNIKNLKTFHLEVKIEDGKLIFNRKLKPGICDSIYGIECSKIIVNNDEFVSNAILFRKELTNEKDLFDSKQSKYNKNLFMNECEICKNKKDLQSHHIIFQKEFKIENKIPFNKNDLHNLVILCEKCHIDLHQNKIFIYGYKDTSNGKILEFKKFSASREG